MDNHSKEVRSYNMSRIRSKNTKPEEIVRKYLFSKGFRFRKNVRKMPGCPDIVLPKYKVVIFVNGCFWHKHDGCSYFVWPKSRQEYWNDKLNNNHARDTKNQKQLESMGWRVVVVWECEMKDGKSKEFLEKLVNNILSNDLFFPKKDLVAQR